MSLTQEELVWASFRNQRYNRSAMYSTVCTHVSHMFPYLISVRISDLLSVTVLFHLKLHVVGGLRACWCFCRPRSFLVAVVSLPLWVKPFPRCCPWISPRPLAWIWSCCGLLLPPSTVFGLLVASASPWSWICGPDSSLV